MFNRNQPAQTKSSEHDQPVDYDQRCIKLDDLEELSIEELTRELVNLYGQIPPASSANSESDSVPN